MVNFISSIPSAEADAKTLDVAYHLDVSSRMFNTLHTVSTDVGAETGTVTVTFTICGVGVAIGR